MKLGYQNVEIDVPNLLKYPGGKLELIFPEGTFADVDISTTTILLPVGERKGASAWVEILHFAHQHQKQETISCILHEGELEVSSCTSEPMCKIKDARLNVAYK